MGMYVSEFGVVVGQGYVAPSPASLILEELPWNPGMAVLSVRPAWITGKHRWVMSELSLPSSASQGILMFLCAWRLVNFWWRMWRGR